LGANKKSYGKICSLFPICNVVGNGHISAATAPVWTVATLTTQEIVYETTINPSAREICC